MNLSFVLLIFQAGAFRRIFSCHSRHSGIIFSTTVNNEDVCWKPMISNGMS